MECIQSKISIDGQDVSYIYCAGKKEARPVLFLHGWGGSSQSFMQLLFAYDNISQENHGDMYAIDFPGFGQSENPSAPWSIEEYAACVSSYVTHLGLKNVHVVCHSFGGRITPILLAKYSNIFTSATCLAPAGVLHTSTRKRILSKLSALSARVESISYLTCVVQFLRKCGRALFSTRDYAALSGTMKETFKKVVASDIRGYFPAIHQPVQLFFGRKDSYVPIQDAHIWHSSLAHAQLTIFDDGRHGLQYTHTQIIASEIIAFLKKI